ncbi:MAG TPA: methyl-accepting chemotaxis protein [Methylibium sp.]|nr:methyl-accepting chemotaxis protein [Methylibium sp.]
MKLSLKLPLAMAGLAAALLAAALFGLYSLDRSLGLYATDVAASVDHERAVRDTSVAFKTQVQEWKNTLLRGKDPKQLDKYWSAFRSQEGKVAQAARQLLERLPEGESRALVAKFAAAHKAMGEGYLKGYEAFVAAKLDATVGDAAVHGMDRAPSKLLDEAETRIAADSAAVAAQAGAQARRAMTLSLVLMLAVCAAGVAGGMWFSRSITRPLGRAVEVAGAVAAGDLSRELEFDGRDEVARLGQALGEMVARLRGVVGEVRQGVESVSTASSQIATGNLDLSARTEQTASNLQQTAASMEQITGTVTQSADTAQQANQLAASAAAAAEQGGAVVTRVVASMQEISDSSKRIADIIGVIDGIAFQTNILALNAAVEAARAGEQGRGFAVVASEVRSLAQRSANAAKEIKALIETSVERVGVGARLAEEAGQSMGGIVQQVRRVTDMMSELSAASREQRDGIGQVNQAMSKLDELTQQNAALVEESAAAASSLKEQAVRLSQVVSVFRIEAVAAPALA